MSISLVLSVPIITYGAVHNLGDPSANTDNKFTIEPEKIYFEGHIDLLSNLIYPDYGLELYLNDQTFADFNSFFYGGYRNTYIRGSFLTDSGFFLGLDLLYTDYDPDYFLDNELWLNTISPGFRLALDDQSYIAASFDFRLSGMNSRIVGYEMNTKVYGEKTKFTGNIYRYSKDGSIDADFGINYQMAEPFIIGANIKYTNLTNSFFSIMATRTMDIGFTYKMDPVIFDVESIFCNYTYFDGSEDVYGQGSYNDSTLSISGMLQLQENLYIGAEYDNYRLAPFYGEYSCLYLKARYDMAKRQSLVFRYGYDSNLTTKELFLAFKLSM
jgi:hypothetical protein